MGKQSFTRLGAYLCGYKWVTEMYGCHIIKWWKTNATSCSILWGVSLISCSSTWKTELCNARSVSRVFPHPTYMCTLQHETWPVCFVSRKERSWHVMNVFCLTKSIHMRYFCKVCVVEKMMPEIFKQHFSSIMRCKTTICATV
jgi:hypothetical protein